MSKAPHTPVHLVATCVVTLMLASCAVPPREAWQEIQSRGLITYYLGHESRPLGATAGSPTLAKSTTPVQTPSPIVGPDRPATPPPAMLNASTMPVAQAVPGTRSGHPGTGTYTQARWVCGWCLHRCYWVVWKGLVLGVVSRKRCLPP